MIHTYCTNEASMPWKPDLVLSSTITLARCFIGLRARLPSGICHQSVPSLYAKVSLFGLIRGVLPIFSQVPVLLNQEPDSCFPWQTQGPGCPELPLVDGGRKGCPFAPLGSIPLQNVLSKNLTTLSPWIDYLGLSLFISKWTWFVLTRSIIGDRLIPLLWCCSGATVHSFSEIHRHSLTLVFNGYQVCKWQDFIGPVSD